MQALGKASHVLASAAVAMLAMAAVSLAAPPPAHAAGKLPAPAWPKVLRSGAHALKLSWEAVEGAESYAVYRYDGDRARYVKVQPSRYGRKVGAKGCRAFSKAVRYRSSDPKTVRLAHVASDYYTQGYWRAEAPRPGTCRVWAVAANGVRSRPVEVTVVDATRPARFTDPGFYDPEVVRWLNDEADAMSRVIKRCLRTGFYTNARLDDGGTLRCNANRYLPGSDKTLGRLKADKALLADVRELLSHDVDGFRVESVLVSSRIVVYFDSDVVEGRRYEIEYTPESRGDSWDWYYVAPYWGDTWMPPVE